MSKTDTAFKPTVTEELSDEQLEKIIYENSKSFFFASQFLPIKQKKAIWSLYAFCRTTDDLVDQNQNATLAQITDWKNDLLSEIPSNPVLKRFRLTLQEYKIPQEYALDLIAGCERDLTQKRYETFTDLSSYCYQVASTVGLMSAYIIGFDKRFEKEMKDKAIKAGIALQLTNIIRDVGEDLKRGRLYLPLEDCKACGCDPEKTDQWSGKTEFKKLIDLQIKRAKSLYREGWTGLKYLNFKGRFSIAAALGVYEHILNEVVNNSYDVIMKRAYVPLWKKLTLLPTFLLRLYKT